MLKKLCINLANSCSYNSSSFLYYSYLDTSPVNLICRSIYSLEKITRGWTQHNCAGMLRGTHKGIGQSKGQQARHAHAAAGRTVSGIRNGICSRHSHRRRIRIRICILICIRIQLRVAVGATVRQSKAENFHIAVMKTQNARI